MLLIDRNCALVDKPRYEVVREDFGDLLRTPPCGLHIHVGMPDPETAVRVANAFCLYLPLLQALSANSPLREGADSGNASSRTSVVRSYRQLGGEPAVEEIERVLRDGNGADDQRRVHRESGMAGLLAHLAEPAL
ncbi:MAG: glutamate-cysteine ligase family protein [Solirubrobacterales bacterium]